MTNLPLGFYEQDEIYYEDLTPEQEAELEQYGCLVIGNIFDDRNYEDEMVIFEQEFLLN